jgi:hypothetical protein
MDAKAATIIAALITAASALIVGYWQTHPQSAQTEHQNSQPSSTNSVSVPQASSDRTPSRPEQATSAATKNNLPGQAFDTSSRVASETANLGASSSSSIGRNVFRAQLAHLVALAQSHRLKEVQGESLSKDIVGNTELSLTETLSGASCRAEIAGITSANAIKCHLNYSDKTVPELVDDLKAVAPALRLEQLQIPLCIDCKQGNADNYGVIIYRWRTSESEITFWLHERWTHLVVNPPESPQTDPTPPSDPQ